ncbi:MAG TPA: hypothetical protein VFF69_10420 [Phycisphaerales bacterium]|nr:hypothetical protein [Phycisphaerales bacterium]
MLGVLLKPWRAHSELEGLSDAECRDLIERRWRRDPPPLRAITVAAALAGLAWLPAVFLFAATQTRLRDDPELNQDVVTLVLGAIGVAGGLAIALLGRWWLVRMVTCRTLRRLMAGATCPRCKHSLIGLPIFDDATRPDDRSRMRVRCPECGKQVRLLKYGYGPEDLAPWSERVLPKDYQVRLKR